MPTPRGPYQQSGDESYPPTQMLLRPSVSHSDGDGKEDPDLLLGADDKDPLQYFLTPATPSGGGGNDDGDDGDDGMDDDVGDMDFFDAGIEDAKHPAPIVRSVSPSNLEGLSRLAPRPPTPPRSSGSPSSEPDLDMAPTPEGDGDVENVYGNGGMGSGGGESFLRLGPGLGRLPLGLPFSLRDFAASRAKKMRRGKEARGSGSSGYLSPPSPSFPFAPFNSSPTHPTQPSARGRSTRRSGPKPIGSGAVRNRARPVPSRSSPHAWREPSPDVWSIEEEPEPERGDDTLVTPSGPVSGSGPTQPIDIPAAKREKKVRFVLPDRET